MIQVEKIWLFETEVLDPLFFGTIDGITTTMKDERTIELLDIALCEYKLTGVVKGGLEWSASFGGEDNGALRTLGKQEYEYTLSFNVPLYSGRIIDEMVGRQFSCLCERRNGTRFVIFGQFEAEPLQVNNEAISRISLSTGKTSAKIYNVNSYNITSVRDTIDIAAICANLDSSNRMDFQFFPTTNIPTEYAIESVSFTSAVVTWKKALGSNGYEIVWGTDGLTFPNTIIIEGGGVETYEITGLPFNDVFYTKIKATGQFVDSLYSGVISGTTAALDIPQNYIISNFTDTTCQADWDITADATGYEIVWGTDGVTFPNSQLVAGGATNTTTITGLPSGTTIYSKILAQTALGDSGFSSISFGDTTGIAYDADAQAWFDLMTSPQLYEKEAINTFFINEKADGNHPLWDEFYLPALGATNGLIGAKGTTATAFGGVTWGVEGATFNGTNAYIDSSFNPSSDGVNFTLNDGLHGGFIKSFTNGGGVEKAFFGVDNGTDFLFFTQNNTETRSRFNVLVGDFLTTNNPPESNYLISDIRTSSNDVETYIDGISEASSNSLSSTAIPNGNIYIGAKHDTITGDESHADCTISSYIIGAGVGFDHAAHNTNVRLLLASLIAQKEVTDIDAANAILNSGTTTASEAVAIETYVLAEKATTNDNWSLTDYFLLFPLGSTNGLNDLKGGTTATANGGLTWSGDGAVFNGTNSYIDTGFNLLNDSTSFTQNDGAVGGFIKDHNYVSGTVTPFGAREALITRFSTWTTGSVTRYLANSGSISDLSTDVLKTASDDLYLIARNTLSTSGVYVNGVLNTPVSDFNATVIPDSVIFVGANSNQGTPESYIDATLSTFIISASANFDHAAHNTNVRLLLASLIAQKEVTDIDAANAILNSGTTTASEAVAIETYVLAEKATTNDNWSLTDYFLLFPLGSTNGLNDLKGGKTATANGGLTWSGDGAIGNGTNAYIASGFIPSTDGHANIGTDSFYSFFIKTATTWTSGAPMVTGARDGSSIKNEFYQTSATAFRAIVNNQQIDTASALQSSTLYAIGFDNAVNEKILYTDGVGTTPAFASATGAPAVEVAILAQNANGTIGNYSSHTLSHYCIGQESGFDHAAHNTNVRQLLTDLGLTL